MTPWSVWVTPRHLEIVRRFILGHIRWSLNHETDGAVTVTDPRRGVTAVRPHVSRPRNWCSRTQLEAEKDRDRHVNARMTLRPDLKLSHTMTGDDSGTDRTFYRPGVVNSGRQAPNSRQCVVSQPAEVDDSPKVRVIPTRWC